MRTGSTLSQPNTVQTPKSLFLALLKWPSILILVGFAVSEVLTDSVYKLQWLWFVPRPLLAASALVWTLAALAAVRVAAGAVDAPRPEARALRWIAAISTAALAYGVLGLWGFPKQRPFGGVRLVHWNASFPDESELPEWAASAVIALDADVVVMTDPGMLVVGERAEKFAAAGYTILRPGRFALLSRLPVVEAVPIVGTKSSVASRIVIETKTGPLAIRAIDLPSDPRLSRIENAHDLAAAIAKVDRSVPDILVGDFNITGGSKSLRAFGEGYTDAFADAGVGWGGTYPQRLPLWRIDLTLVRAPWSAARAEVAEIFGTRHRAQVVDLMHGFASSE